MTVWPMTVICENPYCYIILMNVKTKQIFQNNLCVLDTLILYFDSQSILRTFSDAFNVSPKEYGDFGIIGNVETLSPTIF